MTLHHFYTRYLADAGNNANKTNFTHEMKIVPYKIAPSKCMFGSAVSRKLIVCKQIKKLNKSTIFSILKLLPLLITAKYIGDRTDNKIIFDFNKNL